MKVSIQKQTQTILSRTTGFHASEGRIFLKEHSFYTEHQQKAVDFLANANSYNLVTKLYTNDLEYVDAYYDEIRKIADRTRELSIKKYGINEIAEEDYTFEIERHFKINFSGKHKARYLKASCLKTLSKKIYKQHIREAETANMMLKRVTNLASEDLINHRKEAEIRQRAYLEETYIRNVKTGTQTPLLEIAQSPHAKYSELYLQAKSLEKRAKAEDKSFIFATMTVPARMHSNPIKGKNSWDGTTPTEAKNFLQKRWEQARALIAKKDIDYFGIWSREPHLDATPHMHALIYASKVDLIKIEKILNEKFAHSSKALKIEHDNGDAAPTSYITKYLLKAIGFDATDSKDYEKGVALRASTLSWGYRRYGFFGIQSKLTLWRECRKISENTEVTDLNLRSAIAAAQGNNWKTFLERAQTLKAYTEKTYNCFGEKTSKFIGIVSTETGNILYMKEFIYEKVTLSLSYPRKQEQKQASPTHLDIKTSFLKENTESLEEKIAKFSKRE